MTGKPNLGDACILGTFGHETPPKAKFWSFGILPFSYCCGDERVMTYGDVEMETATL